MKRQCEAIVRGCYGQRRCPAEGREYVIAGSLATARQVLCARHARRISKQHLIWTAEAYNALHPTGKLEFLSGDWNFRTPLFAADN